VDFVLESGNGELDDTVDLSMDTQSLEDGVAGCGFGKQPPTPSPETSTLPSTTHEYENLALHANPNENKIPGYRQIIENQGIRHRQRSWPLRDPEEAYLLKHFVDQTSSFVSEYFNTTRPTAALG
jgi:hypothetical protein